MSVANEIQRLQSAKVDIKTAIENKGVTVGDGLIDTYAGKISEISTGGGSAIDNTKFCYAIRFNNLNIFGKSEVVLDLDNVTTLNSFYNLAAKASVANETVEKLTLNCKKPITDMYAAFIGSISYEDTKIKTLVLNIDTSPAENFNNCFVGMKALERIEGTPLDFTSCKNLNQPFRNCSALKELRVKPNTIKLGFGIQNSHNLSTDTIQSIIDGLADLTGQTEQILDLHSDIIPKLTSEQIDQIYNKNWSVT